MAGYVYRPKYTTPEGERKQSSKWHIGYSINGKKYREPANTASKRKAEQFLAERLASRGQAGPSARDLAKVTFDDLADIIRADYARNQRKSTSRLERSIAALAESFEGTPVPALDEATIASYVENRLDEGYANATINRELAALKRMFKLGYKQRLVGRIPHIDLLREDNVRKGFWSEDELQEVLKHLPPELRPLIETAYLTGWRKGELLSRQWRHVDFDAGWLRLEPGETKNREGRQFPLTDRLRGILRTHLDKCRQIATEQERIIPHLFFHYDGPYEGQQITTIQKQWKAARKAAGLWHPGKAEHRIFHDFRRTAVRNLVRAGIREGVAMKMTGHKTRSVFERYNIVDEADLSRAGDLLDKAQEG